MQNETIYIFGGAGSIGAELTRQLCRGDVGNNVFVFDINETEMFDLVEELRLDGRQVAGGVVDIRDRDALARVFARTPDFVINAAARKHVTPMQETPMEAVSVNVQGVVNLLDFCRRQETKFIQISTDKVVQTASVMGATKKLAELIVRNAGYTSVRFGNVMGSRGSVIPIWQKQMDQGKPLTVTDANMQRYMMTIEEACSLVIDVMSMDDVDGKVVCLDMGERVKILDLAKKILGKEDGIRMIGMRPGEMLVERLMSEEEESRAEKRGRFYII